MFMEWIPEMVNQKMDHIYEKVPDKQKFLILIFYIIWNLYIFHWKFATFSTSYVTALLHAPQPQFFKFIMFFHGLSLNTNSC